MTQAVDKTKLVMAGFIPAIHVGQHRTLVDVDARLGIAPKSVKRFSDEAMPTKPGHDDDSDWYASGLKVSGA